ncbi:MAG: hypothetical protein NWP80_01635 [Candidatus Gracilibacteria bacterium]|nr:hypothetical protein [Candidatus Gracilibacteria bacterium]
MVEKKINSLLSRKDIFLPNPKKVGDFLNNYILEDTIFVFDFDGTLTKKGEHSSFMPVNLPTNVNPEFYEYKKVINKYYQKIEFSHSFEEIIDDLDYKDKLLAKSGLSYESFKHLMMEKWFKEVMDLGLLLKNDLSNIDYSKVHFRENASDVLNNLKNKNAEILIVSAGIKNFITGYFDFHKVVNGIKIIGNEFMLDNLGIVNDYNKEIITTFTKHNIDYKKHGIPEKKFAMQFGDTIGDSNIVAKHFHRDNLLNIGFLNGDIDSLDQFSNKFDIVLKNKESGLDFLGEIIDL